MFSEFMFFLFFTALFALKNSILKIANGLYQILIKREIIYLKNMSAQEIVNSLNGFKNSELIELANFLNCKQFSSGTNKEIIDYLIKEQPYELKEFVTKYEKLKRLNINKARDILSENIHGITLDELQAITGRKHIILLLYRKDRLDLIHEIVFACKIYKEKIKRDFIIKTQDSQLGLDKITSNIDGFTLNWNKTHLRKLSYSKKVSESRLSIWVFVEKNKIPISSFKFRDTEGLEYSAKAGLEITTRGIYPVYTKLLEILNISKSEFMIRVDFKYENEIWFNNFLSSAFGKFEMISVGEAEIKKLYEGLKEVSENDSSLEGIRQEIRNLKDILVNRIKADEKIPAEKRLEYEAIAQTISYGGLTFKNDPITTTKSFLWSFADIQKAEKVIPGMGRLVEDFYSKIPQSKDSFFINLNGKGVIIADNGVKQTVNLSQDELKIIKMFFGIE